ncbi:glycosyltransferase N-terminal domain-containing protein [Rapidithrix thailandica]|uniref:3-deoxy-D-manno-octulosonic acid transferase n=1 Tax=Rapidithrix thailandica TaxID=413964 RepID=A0AAW9S6P0_9BACT
MYILGKLLYKAGLMSYWALIKFASIFHAKAQQFVQGRKEIFTKLEVEVKGNQSPIVWVHCASLGEFEQGRPVIEQIKKQYPSYKILLTFFSPSGYEVQKNYPHADFICYLPYDSAANAQRLVEIIRPKLAFFVKYEFWYYHLKALHRKNVPVMLISAFFRENQLFFKKNYGAFYRSLLNYFEHFFVQDENSAHLLKQIGYDNVTVVGDTRFDQVKKIAESRKSLQLVEQFKGDKSLLVMGSSWPEDVAVVSEALKNDFQGLKIIVAPHEIAEANLQKTEQAFSGKKMIRYSQAEGLDLAGYDMLLIDNIGLLSSIYGYADYAFVGGGYKQGVHNTLEPAVFGIPVFYGDQYYTQWREADELARQGGGLPVKNAVHFKEKMLVFFHQPLEKEKTGRKARAYVYGQKDVKDQILDYCSKYLN